MPLEWLIGVKRRSVEKDYRFYDPPGLVYEKISSGVWPYKTNRDFLELRDLAFMCLSWLTCSRTVELVRGPVKAGFLPSIRVRQFVQVEEDFIEVRDLPIVKRANIEDISDYPKRQSISMPLRGELSVFTDPIMKLLDQHHDPDAELFKFKQKRAWQIVNHITGEMPHYLRDMGLKFRLRLYKMNIRQLQAFSGHARIDNLVRYLDEAEDKQALLDAKL